ncbi:hypothetical protein P154DRAFT_525129 [Amniculicola lignicola CBS 123094]|uniref:Uncharacterized protein n=1 Tax=Amniculicola lignicola CBS 123094 TaxID=1392246 RepID=A0A6A5W5K3_9PLEO|nr:hypothetical protein P154DRAFT_525129 [Amniculicola lignicola CBS 123094]
MSMKPGKITKMRSTIHVRSDILEQSKKSINIFYSRMTDAVAALSKVETLAFVTQMRAILPRELLDLVYYFYFDKRQTAKAAGIILALEMIPTPEVLSDMWKRTPHFLLPEFAGFDTAREAAEVFYKKWEPKFGPEVLQSHIRFFDCLHTDHFQLGLDPSNLVRSNMTFYLTYIRGSGPDVNLSIPLEILFDLPHLHKMALDFRIEGGLREIYHVFLDLDPVCERLYGEGVRFTVGFFCYPRSSDYYDVTDIWGISSVAGRRKMWNEWLNRVYR